MKFAFGVFLTALAVFAWEAVSWTMLGWHESGYRQFRDESHMAEILGPSLSNSKTQVSSGAGIYVMPAKPKENKLFKPREGAANEYEAQSEQAEIKKALEEYEQARNNGPTVYAIIRPGKREISMANNLILSFVRCLICATLIAGMLSLTMLHYPARIAFVAAAGLFAGLACDMPMWVWFENPGGNTIVNIMDAFFTWVIGGAVMGLFVGKDVVLTKGH
jgi:hypothetical protein